MCTDLTAFEDFTSLSQIRLSSNIEMDSYVLVKDVLYPMSCRLTISHCSLLEIPYFSLGKSSLLCIEEG
jgi:hypothetical protein